MKCHKKVFFKLFLEKKTKKISNFLNLLTNMISQKKKNVIFKNKWQKVNKSPDSPRNFNKTKKKLNNLFSINKLKIWISTNTNKEKTIFLNYSIIK